MASTTATCDTCSALQMQLSSMQEAAEQSHEASEVGDRAMRLELDAADKTGAKSKARAHVASVTMQNELESAERQLSVATALTQQTLLEARAAAREADVRQAAVASELPLAESGNALAPQVRAAHLHECFARLSGAIEEVQPHLQEQVRAQHSTHVVTLVRPTSSAWPRPLGSFTRQRYRASRRRHHRFRQVALRIAHLRSGALGNAGGGAALVQGLLGSVCDAWHALKLCPNSQPWRSRIAQHDSTGAP